MPAMRLDDFDFDLPPGLIAQAPVAERSDSRLLCVGPQYGGLTDRTFRDIAELTAPGDVLVLNDTRVIKARLAGRKKSGGKVEVLVERVLSRNLALAQVRANRPPRLDGVLLLADAIEVTVVGRRGEFYELCFAECDDLFALLERHGSVPLPPYIERAAAPEDESRYQTVYARAPGAVAAPTAGLHFDEPLLATLRERGVGIAHITLHVGAGTFQPVRVQDLTEHEMHAEWFDVTQAAVDTIERAIETGHNVVAVGTTSLRALETAGGTGRLRAGYGETKLFIVPGYRFRIVDRLVTNFHLPKSTLLMLVCAFAGMRTIQEAYRHAVEHGYRFFSYGDAMLLERQQL
jgi:S-adenosylmethionine:tRNA ribosyltransferase-isomerase